MYRFNKSILVNRSRDEVGSVTTSRTLNTAGKDSRRVDEYMEVQYIGEMREEVCSTYRVLAKGLLAGVLSPNAWFLSQMYR